MTKEKKTKVPILLKIVEYSAGLGFILYDALSQDPPGAGTTVLVVFASLAEILLISLEVYTFWKYHEKPDVVQDLQGNPPTAPSSSGDPCGGSTNTFQMYGPPTAPSSSGEILAIRTDTCGFPILIAKCAGKTVKLFDKNGIQGAQIDIPDGWELEAVAFNNNQDPAARYNSLLCIFHKIGAFETKENRAWTWKVPNQDKVWNAITEADVKATPLPWAKPPK
jgi:hypothetical protein